MKLIAIGLLIGTPVFAQSTAPSSQPAVQDLIVVTASDLSESVDSTPASVSVITRDDIQRRAARDVADVLREVPGVVLARSGSAGKATSLFMRGAASTQTLVLWNGIEINNPYFSGYDWGRFSTAGVEQIEVVRGPYSALYGSEAMAGVINVLTAAQRSAIHGRVEGGTHGLRNASFGLAQVGASTELTASAERRQDDGFNPNDDFRQNSGQAMWKWAPSKSLSLGLAARHTSYDLGIPFNTDAAATALVPSLQRRQTGHETQISLPTSFQFAGLFNEIALSENRRVDDFRDPEDPFIKSSTTRSNSRRARLSSHTAATSLGTVVFGAEYDRASVTDLTDLGPNFEDRRQTNHALFIEDRYSHAIGPASRFELSAGVRHDNFDTFGSQTSPRIAAAVAFGGNKIRAAYGRGFRAPSLGELYFPFYGNPDVKAERNRSFEAGYDAIVGRNGLWSLTYFSGRYRDLITFDPTTFITENIGRVRTEGIEASLQQQWASIYLAGSYTYLHRDDDEATGLRLLRRPKHSGSITAGYRLTSLDASVTVLRTGVRSDDLPIAPFSLVQVRGFTTIDATLSTRRNRFGPFMKVENVRDTRYEEVLGFASPRRRVIVGLRFDG